LKIRLHRRLFSRDVRRPDVQSRLAHRIVALFQVSFFALGTLIEKSFSVWPNE
jgi:hypothetical protein